MKIKDNEDAEFYRSNEIPNQLSSLAKINKAELVSNLSEEPFKNAVKDVFMGKNVREFTESLTRVRLLRSYAAFIQFYVETFTEEDAMSKAINKSVETLKNKKFNNDNEALVVKWILGLTDKLSQNLLRDSLGEEFNQYVDKYKENTIQTSKEAIDKIGDIEVKITLKKEDKTKKIEIDWSDLLFILNSIGAQTLTIRGSEKSLHGKNFEKLVLGSVFQLLGFELVKKDSLLTDKPCFWLSSVEEGERESDATLINNNEGLRVDIGFIGRGNSEISLDKVSRYRQQADINGGKYEMSTVIIVDRIGDKSGIVEKAEEIKGKIFQMCNKNWIVELAQCVYDKLGVDVGFHLIKDDKELIAKIEEEMEKVSIKDLLNN